MFIALSDRYTFAKKMKIIGLLLFLSAIVYSPQLMGQDVTPPPDPKTVKVLFTVIDKDKQQISTIGKDDLNLVEDGIPQKISDLKSQRNVPISLAIILDSSASQEAVLPLNKIAAQAFLKAIIRQGQDQATIISMAERVSVEQPLTDELAKLQAAINSVKFVPPPGYVGGGVIVSNSPPKGHSSAGSTGLWDALFFACETALSPAKAGTRKAIVLFSDGVDTGSHLKMYQAVEQAFKQDVAIYSVGVGNKREFGLESGKLRKISEQTGGRAYFPEKTDELQSGLQQILQELRTQYVLTFVPYGVGSKEGYRKLKLSLVDSGKKGDKLNIAHRQGYFPER